MVNREYERALIGRILQDPDTLYKVSITTEHLGDPLCKDVLAAINADVADGIEPSIITVTQRDTLVHYAAEIAQLTSEAAFSNLGFYEREILKAWRLRRIRKLGEHLTKANGQPDDIINSIEQVIQELTSDGDADRVYAMNELVMPAIAEIEKRYHAQGKLPGLETGFDALDAMLNGLQPRRLYFIGARPSQGKSAILLNMATHIGVKKGVSVGFISAESSKEELILRDFSNLGGVDSHRISNGFLKQVDFIDIQDAAGKLHTAPIYIYDSPNIGITRLISVAKMMHRRHKIKALFVDYVQIIGSTLSKDPKREQVAEVSLKLKALSRQLDIPVIAAAQLTRDSQNRRPTLADFADSSQIEKDADAALLLQQERDDDDNLVRVWGRLEKNRDGRTGSIKLHFKGEYVRFTEEARLPA